MQAKDVLQSLAEKADIRINGNRPWDVQVHNENLYRRVLGQGTLGLGEAYMDGWWDCERMDVMIEKALNARVDGRISGNLPTLLHVAAQKLFNLQSVARAGIVAERHYNAERAMFETMLDPYMQYSCAYWRALPDQAGRPRRSGRRPEQQNGAHLPQTETGRRAERTGHRLRMGRAGPLYGRALRRAGDGRHSVRRAIVLCSGARRPVCLWISN